MTKDIFLTTSVGAAIEVKTDCVEINLNGKTITDLTGTNTLIRIKDGVSDTTIYDGCLSGGRRGIDYFSSSGFGTSGQIRDVKVKNSIERDISFEGARNIEISSCQVERIGGNYGVYVNSGATPHTGRLVGNTVTYTDGWGIYSQGLEGGEVRNNIVRQFGKTFATAGIQLDGQSAFFVGGNEVSSNKVSDGDGDGLIVGEASRNNLIRDNTLYEIRGRGL